MIGLIGESGFVGGSLKRQLNFDRLYNSKNIEEIRGCKFSTLICAGAPADMWKANSNPIDDRINIENLIINIEESQYDCLVLISTIAVFDKMSAGYVEGKCAYEENIPYGKNRRFLEEALADRRGMINIRLPALFGTGLKKNFVFDIMNPVPSFMKMEAYETTMRSLSITSRNTIEQYFRLDEPSNTMRLNRKEFDESENRHDTEAELHSIGRSSLQFTNSESLFQYYNVDKLSQDIEILKRLGIETMNICSEPMSAGKIYHAVKGEHFTNSQAAVVQEDVRTENASNFGRAGPYLYGADETLTEIMEFVASGSRSCG